MTKKLPTKPKQLAYLHRKIRTSYRGRGSYNRFAKEHSCSPHTAKKWIDKALSTTYSANFKFVNGRPAYLNSESKDFLMEQITKKGLMGNAISSKQYHINSTTALTLVEEASQRQRETDPNRLTKSLTADQAKFQLKQAGAYTKSAQETTPDHYLHLNCIYNCVIMVITAIFLLKYLPHWGLFFNLEKSRKSSCKEGGGRSQETSQGRSQETSRTEENNQEKSQKEPSYFSKAFCDHGIRPNVREN
jgi:transposase